jgi:hypothetical protein
VPLEQLPPGLLAAALCGLYCEFLRIHVYQPIGRTSALSCRPRLYSNFSRRPTNPSQIPADSR